VFLQPLPTSFLHRFDTEPEHAALVLNRIEGIKETPRVPER
jgi:hypothetical protein